MPSSTSKGQRNPTRQACFFHQGSPSAVMFSEARILRSFSKLGLSVLPLCSTCSAQSTFTLSVTWIAASRSAGVPLSLTTKGERAPSSTKCCLSPTFTTRIYSSCCFFDRCAKPLPPWVYIGRHSKCLSKMWRTTTKRVLLWTGPIVVKDRHESSFEICGSMFAACIGTNRMSPFLKSFRVFLVFRQSFLLVRPANTFLVDLSLGFEWWRPT